MKKTIAMLLTTALLLTGCGAGQGNAPTDAQTTETQQEETAETAETEEMDGAATDDATEDGDEGYEDAAEIDIEAILAEMSLRDKIEQMMVPAFRVWKDLSKDEDVGVNITEPNDEVRRALKEHHFGGTLLFSENYVDADQTVRLIADLQETNREGGGLPLLVATDQEGGRVARVGFGTTGVGNMALAATGDPENARIMASIYGEELHALGVNTDFAPVLDVNNNPNNPVIGVRSFSDDPEEVAAFGLSYMEGLKGTGTIATLKHFPGHGNTGTDSHTGFPCIDSTYEELQRSELVPFQAAIDAGADMIMTAHIQYPQIESETYVSITTGEQVYLPATMSKTILTDILREDMGFEGVIVSDGLEMAAIADNFSQEDILLLTINAGVNMLLMPQVIDSGYYENLLNMTDMAVSLAEDGKIDTDRIDDSVRRILKLKEKYGLLSQSDFSVTQERLQAADETVGSEEHRVVAWEIAEKALTVLKNENDAFPFRLEAGQSVFVIFADSCASCGANWALTEQILKENGAMPEGIEVSSLIHTTENEAECIERAREADHVILVYRTYNAACLDPSTADGFSSATFDRIIEARHQDGKQVTLISCQLPYDAARFPDADAILLTYNASSFSVIPPASGAGSAYIPNLPAALCACLGVGEAKGQLPVNIPTLDEAYQMEGTILFERGTGIK